MTPEQLNNMAGLSRLTVRRFIFRRIAAFSISLINDKTESASPALDALFMDSIVDTTIYKENTLEVSLEDLKLMSNTTVVYEFFVKDCQDNVCSLPSIKMFLMRSFLYKCTYFAFSFFFTITWTSKNCKKNLLFRKIWARTGTYTEFDAIKNFLIVFEIQTLAIF